MLTTTNSFDSRTILDGIRRWVEIETPTEAPEQVNRLADLVTEGYRDLPATIERLPFQIDGDSAFGPGIYDMKGGAYLAYHAFRQICAHGARSPLGVTQLFVSDEE